MKCFLNATFGELHIYLNFSYCLFQFEKPGRRDNFDYPDMAVESVTKALKDANINYDQIKQAAVGYVYGKIK